MKIELGAIEIRSDGYRAFCPTGEGGGVDPSCSPGGGGSGSIASRSPRINGSPAETRVGIEISQYGSYESFTNPGFNTAGGRRWPFATKGANGILEAEGEAPQDYELRVVKTKDVIPSQEGEDYINESSEETARNLKIGRWEEAQQDDSEYGLRDFLESQRMEDINPIAIKADGTIIDGNHRHAAATINKEKEMLAFVAVGKGTGKIKNLESAYKALGGR